MASEVPVEWTEGSSRHLWRIGYLSATYGSLAGGLVLAWRLGLMAGASVSVVNAGLVVGVGAGVMLPVTVAFLWFAPTPARVGVIDGGILVELGSSRVPALRVRQGYRWRELRLAGNRLVLPKRGRAPRSLRLTSSQAQQLGPLIASRIGSSSGVPGLVS